MSRKKKSQNKTLWLRIPEILHDKLVSKYGSRNLKNQIVQFVYELDVKNKHIVELIEKQDERDEREEEITVIERQEKILSRRKENLKTEVKILEEEIDTISKKVR